MEQLTDLKAILHSKRANIYYLEKCRVMQKDGRVLYLTEAKDQNYYWVILHKGTQRTIGFFANPFATLFSANFIPSKLYLSLGCIFGG